MPRQTDLAIPKHTALNNMLNHLLESMLDQNNEMSLLSRIKL